MCNKCFSHALSTTKYWRIDGSSFICFWLFSLTKLGEVPNCRVNKRAWASLEWVHSPAPTKNTNIMYNVGQM